jgi:DNA (cytosine-5)-methyltransferase 1
MGFDRPDREKFRIVVSDTQAYKQFGNAVAVPVVEAIAKAVRTYLPIRSITNDLAKPVPQRPRGLAMRS